MNDVELEVLYDYLQQTNRNIEASNSYLSDVSEYTFDIASTSTDIRELSRSIEASVTKLVKTNELNVTDASSIRTNIEQREALKVDPSVVPSIRDYISAIQSITPVFTSNYKRLLKSFSVVANAISRSFSGQEISKAADVSRGVSSFLRDYAMAIQQASSKAIGRHEIRNLQRNFDLLKTLSLSDAQMETVRNIGSALSPFSKGLTEYMSAVKALDKSYTRFTLQKFEYFLGSIRKTTKILIDAFKGADLARLEKSMNVLGSMGRNVLSYMRALALAGVTSVFIAPGLTAFKLSLAVLRPQFDYLAKKGRDLERGSKALIFIGLGLLSMTATMVAASVAVQKIGITDLVVGTMTVVGLSYAVSRFFDMMGTGKNRNFKAGIANVVLMNFSLLTTTATLWLISKMQLDTKAIGLALLAVGATALLYYQIGKNSTTVLRGTLAVGLMGASLLLLSVPIAILAATLKGSISTVFKVPLLLSTLLIPYVLAGKGLMTIVQGSLAFAAVGLSLLLLAPPLALLTKTFSKIGWGALFKVPAAITALGLVYAGAGLLFAPILAGSVALGAMGLSLYSIAKAMALISKSEFSKEKVDSFADSLQSVIAGMSTAFKSLSVISAAKMILTGNRIATLIERFSVALSHWQSVTGSWSKNDTELLSSTITSVQAAMVLGVSPDYISKTYGITVTQKEIKRGISSTMKLGKNLRQLADGIIAWKTLSLSQEEAKEITQNITTVLSVLPATVAKVGRFYDRKNSDEQAQLAYESGQTYTRKQLRLGLRYTSKIGTSLKRLADGVREWKQLKLTEEETQTIDTNIQTILTIIPGLIAKIGDDDQTATRSGLFGLWTKTDTERGIKYVRGIGDGLKDLGEAVRIWKSIKLTTAETTAISTNISRFLDIIPSTIAKIGDDDQTATRSGLFGLWTKTDTERGLKYVKGLGTPLKDLSESVLNWKNAKISKEDMTLITNNVKDVITALPGTFAEIGRSKDTDKGFWGLFKSDAEKGVKIIQKLTSPLAQMSDIMTKFNAIQDPADRARQIGEGIKVLLQRVVDGFLGLDSTKVETFSKFIDPFRKFTEIYLKFAKELKDDMGNFDGLAKVIEASNDFYERHSATRSIANSAYTFEIPQSMAQNSQTKTTSTQDSSMSALIKRFEEIMQIVVNQNNQLSIQLSTIKSCVEDIPNSTLKVRMT